MPSTPTGAGGPTQLPLFRAQPQAEYYFEEGCYILEHLNDAADPAASIARARVPAGGATRSHRLTGITERYYVLQGSGRAEVGGVQISIEPGDVVLIPPDTVQRVVNTGAGDLVFLAICTPRFRPDCYRQD
jgi:mannose-6-phosphate isomerase-like protein (cupin superfamily)